MKTARFFASSFAVGLAVLAAGCQSSNPTKDVSDLATTPPTVRESELRAYCPNVALRSGTAFYSTYARGGDGDPEKLNYQASLTDVTRSCTYEGDNLTIKVAAAGRVVPGPAGTAGTVTMPIRVAVVRGSEVLYSELKKQEVSVGDAATQFLFTDPAITIPMPPQRNVSIFVGFDEGPSRR